MPESTPHDSEDARILVVEDDPFIREALQTYLEREGFAVDVTANGDGMRICLAGAVPTVVIMDLRLPGEDGIELTRYLRENYDLGIIILTTKSELIDRVVGLEVGADDYLTKPYEPRELLARIRSLLRRLEANKSGRETAPAQNQPCAQSASIYRFGDCVLNGARRCLIGPDGTSLDLTASELRLLNIFVENPFAILSRSDLMQTVYQRDWNPLDRSIDVLVTRIRRKLGGMTDNPAVIRSVRGVGYELATDVTAE